MGIDPLIKKLIQAIEKRFGDELIAKDSKNGFFRIYINSKFKGRKGNRVCWIQYRTGSLHYQKVTEILKKYTDIGWGEYPKIKITDEDQFPEILDDIRYILDHFWDRKLQM